MSDIHTHVPLTPSARRPLPAWRAVVGAILLGLAAVVIVWRGFTFVSAVALGATPPYLIGSAIGAVLMVAVLVVPGVLLFTLRRRR